MKLKRINSKDKYQALLKVIFSQDLSSKDSIMRTLLINKVINYLFIKLPTEEKPLMLNILKSGITIEFLDFMNEKLNETDIENIFKSVNSDVREIFNYALIEKTNGN